MSEKLSDLFLVFNRDAILKTVRSRLQTGEDPLGILDECRRGMTAVGESFQKGDFFLAELILSAEIFKEVAALIEPQISRQSCRWASRTKCGTTAGYS